VHIAKFTTTAAKTAVSAKVSIQSEVASLKTGHHLVGWRASFRTSA